MLSSMIYALSRRSRRFRPRNIIVILFILVNFLEVVYIHRNIANVERNKSIEFQSKKASPQRKKVYIATPLWNADAMLRGPYGDWNNALLNLIVDLGTENVYLTILEGGSYDDTKGGLRELDEELGRLGVRRNITMEDETHADLIARPPDHDGGGWITSRKGARELRRIPYLSKIRNRTLQPLQDLFDAGETFDYVLFLGDVIFNSEDVFTLMETNGGDYAAACALDFSHPPLYYDTFVLRDSHSNPHLHPTWPYFRSRTSRSALKQHQPVPVASCWNGIVSMPAAPFVSKNNPLRFRGLPDNLASRHLEASECCLIHADSELFAQKPVLMNPAVRVGYNQTAYDAVHKQNPWLSMLQIFYGLWENRFKRFLSAAFHSDKGRYMHFMRVFKAAQLETGTEEIAPWCVVDEMQVLSAIGWRHV
ncbi:hypothetical protein EJ08DRAFT_319693 [Tothia fuscella]|uniref:Glycosyltransferase family 69 protein n=1 Tax=Tothia fuscella TaxID=1048955 RepID=A0A9P4NNV5_9PEZI|nr:hypothetical protein EJ08DRAFT_319693 [Tothia fuscella]